MARETPVPLRIDIQHGSGDIDQVALDIFGLTKLNYNACKLGDSEPVTVGFSDAVGEILVSNPRTVRPNPGFKFYIGSFRARGGTNCTVISSASSYRPAPFS